MGARMDSPTESELSFPRPPIVEAVVERRFATSIGMDVIEALRRQFEPEYPAISQLAEMSVMVNPVGAQPQVSQNMTGYRLADRNASAVMVISTNGIAFSRLAPYPGWRAFSEGAAEVFQIARETMKYSTLSRIGVRYINRIDIPVTTAEAKIVPIQLKDYLLIYPEFPASILPPALGYTMQCITFLPNIECRATIGVATVPPAVPHHLSVVFDIDLGREVHVPQREDEISEILDLIRSEKNRIFVSCLTDKAKELFQ
jgi:uncharacterized protein (TIGR04255 family)